MIDHASLLWEMVNVCTVFANAFAPRQMYSMGPVHHGDHIPRARSIRICRPRSVLKAGDCETIVNFK